MNRQHLRDHMNEAGFVLLDQSHGDAWALPAYLGEVRVWRIRTGYQVARLVDGKYLSHAVPPGRGPALTLDQAIADARRKARFGRPD